MSVEIHRLMKALACQRPIFHSEADLQLTLFRYINSRTSDCRVQLEKPFRIRSKSARVDIWLPEESVVIELKYFTRELSVCFDGELFSLREHAARDLARHGFLADVQRVEELAHDGTQPVRSGFAVILTNDPGLWEPPRHKFNDANFQLNEGRTAGPGKLPWLKKGLPIEGDEITLCSTYTMNWKPYSHLEIEAGEFRYLALEVGRRS